MPRLRGPSIALPQGEDAWPFLNERIYGSAHQGGHHTHPEKDLSSWSWDEVFGRKAPLLLEVGFNRGKFITELARQNPDANVVGIEIRRRFGIRLTQMVSLAGEPRNLRVIWGDAKILLPLLFGPQSLDGIFITFPDPWWKKRHFKRRLVDTDFASGIAQRLKPGGQVWVKSDVEMIADEIRGALHARPELGEPIPFAQDDLPLTHREKSCLAQGMPIHRFKLTRLDIPYQADFQPPPIRQDD